jgi:hypothetical protein
MEACGSINLRAYSSVDRALGSGPRCRGFDPLYAHNCDLNLVGTLKLWVLVRDLLGTNDLDLDKIASRS